MKRVILAFVAFVAVIAIAGVFGIVWYLQPPPVSYRELELMQDDVARAAKELPRIVSCFDYNNEDVRLQAAITLGKVGGPAVDPVRARLKDSNPKVRFCAVQALTFMGPEAAPASADLVACLSDDDVDVRRKAAYALGRLGVTTDAVIDGLTKATRDQNPDVSSAAGDSLEHLGPAAAPRMYQLLADAPGLTRDRILAALVKTGAPPKDALPILAELTKESATRHRAMQLLAQLGEPAAPTFRELLQKANEIEQVDVLDAIGSMGASAKPLLPDLQPYLVRPGFNPAESVVLGLFKKCGPDGAKGLAEAAKALAAQKPRDARFVLVLSAIGEMGPTAKDAVPTLVDIMNAQPPAREVRRLVLQTLGDIGPAAREAIPAVEALAKDPAMATQATASLRRMGVVIEKK